MIGTFESTDLGNKYLHDKHEFVIEDLGNKYLRARNLTQHVIDKLFINELIDKHQHQAGEYVLGVCVKSGIFQGGLNLNYSGKQTDMKNSSNKLLKSLLLRKVSKMFVSVDAIPKSKLFTHLIDVIVENKIKRESDIHLLKLGLNVVSNSLYHSDLDKSKDSCSLAIQSVVQA
jgi:hypothetical protein